MLKFTTLFTYGRNLATWFLEIDPVRDVCMCLCVRPRGY